MTTPWFDPNAWAWLPGTLFGCLGGMWGTVASILAPRGKSRGLVLGSGVLLMIASVAMLVAAFVAYLGGQPYGIWYGLGLPGVLGIIILPPRLPVLSRSYRQAEERRMTAQDLRA